MTTQSSTSVLINGFGVLFVILNSFGLGLRLPVGKLLAEASAWFTERFDTADLKDAKALLEELE